MTRGLSVHFLGFGLGAPPCECSHAWRVLFSGTSSTRRPISSAAYNSDGGAHISLTLGLGNPGLCRISVCESDCVCAGGGSALWRCNIMLPVYMYVMLWPSPCPPQPNSFGIKFGECHRKQGGRAEVSVSHVQNVNEVGPRCLGGWLGGLQDPLCERGMVHPANCSLRAISPLPMVPAPILVDGRRLEPRLPTPRDLAPLLR